MTIIDGEYFPLFLGVLFVLLTLVGFRLTCAAQPLRLRLAERIEELSAKQALPQPVRTHLEVLADTAFGMRGQLILSVVAIPIIAIVFVVRNRIIRRTLKEMHIGDAGLQNEFDEIFRLHRLVTRANHPLLFALVELELIVFMTAATLLRAIIKGILPDNDERDILNVLEDGHLGLLKLQRAAASTR